jgi:hypothetical protein
MMDHSNGYVIKDIVTLPYMAETNNIIDTHYYKARTPEYAKCFLFADVWLNMVDRLAEVSR